MQQKGNFHIENCLFVDTTITKILLFDQNSL